MLKIFQSRNGDHPITPAKHLKNLNDYFINRKRQQKKIELSKFKSKRANEFKSLRDINSSEDSDEILQVIIPKILLTE